MENALTENGLLKAVINYGEVLFQLDEKGSKNPVFETFSKDTVLEIHRTFSNLLGEDSRCIDENTFDLLYNAPFQCGFGVDFYPGPYLKAAKILEGFATHQVFENGNKRLAVAAMMQYLNYQNIEFNMSKDKIYEFVMDIANENFEKGKDDIECCGSFVPASIYEIATIIKENSRDFEKEFDPSLEEKPPFGSAKTFDKEAYDQEMEQFNEEEQENKEIES